MAKARDLRELDSEALIRKEKELRKEFFELRSSAATGGKVNPARIRQIKREIARIKTILREAEQ
jgi:large subunit ribosomal protein L29